MLCLLGPFWKRPVYPVCGEVQDWSGMLLYWSLACLFLGTRALSLFSGAGGGGSVQQRVPETLCGSWQITSPS